MKKLHAVTAILLPILLLIPGCAPAALDCTQPDVFCVGLVTEVGRRDDRAYNQAAWEGIRQAKSEGIANWTTYIETIDARDYEENIRVFAEASYDAIVTVGRGSSNATYSAAGQYPGIYFIGVDQRQPEGQTSLQNLAWLVFPEDQIGYLAGAMAALVTQTGQIGAVCGSDVWLPMQNYGEGFRAGAAFINPDVHVTVIYHNDVGLDTTFTDPEWGAATANALVDSGADVIFGVGGATGNNALVAAAMRGVLTIGADTDQYELLPVAAPRVLTSILKIIPPGMIDLIQAAKDAQKRTAAFPAGNYLGKIGLAPYHELAASISEDVKTRIADINEQLKSSTIQTGVTTTNP